MASTATVNRCISSGSPSIARLLDAIELKSRLTLFTHLNEIEIHLYDGTGQYPGLQDLPEDAPASEHRSDSLLNGGDKLCELFDPSRPLNEVEYDFEYLDTPEQSDAIYTPEDLSSWNLLSDPSATHAPIVLSRELIQSSPVPDSPGQDLEVPVPAPGAEIALAVGSALAPPLPGNLCNGKCRGDLSGPHRCQRPQGKLKITCLDGSSCNHTFTTKNDFNRHCRTKHTLRSRQLIDCEIAGCNRVGSEGFSRRDNMRQHMRVVHRAACPITQFQVRGPVHGFV
ncbi:hypothetical protein DFP73DRAFT_600561 [Morchella snyderi]|nr:hypothetical protein DFP73DRAFT_600561 [Morchella snyderi]